jgi:hypothetical protein
MKIPDLLSIAIAVLVLVLGVAAEAQQQSKKVRRIGYLFTGFQTPKEFLDSINFPQDLIERLQSKLARLSGRKICFSQFVIEPSLWQKTVRRRQSQVGPANPL